MHEAPCATKESLRSSADHSPPPVGDARIPPKEAESKDQEHNREGQINCTTWIIGACLAGALIVSKLQQTKRPASVVAGPAIKLAADKPPDA